MILRTIKKKIFDFWVSLPHIKAKTDMYLKKIRTEYDYTKPVPSIICSTCIGGLIYHNLGLQFKSPTINLWMGTTDFARFACNLKEYLACDMTFIPNPYGDFPVGKLKDVVIYFNHYKTQEEALKKWKERSKRIDFDNLYFITSDVKLTDEDIIRLGKLECKRVVVFTSSDRSHLPNTLWMKRYEKDGMVGQYSVRDMDGFREFEKSFDYVKWLNGEKDFAINE